MNARKAAVRIERGSGNVYSDLAHPDAEQMQVKAGLVAAIGAAMAEQELTQAAAAELIGVPQPKLSNLLRGQFHGISERRLMDCLVSLGRDVEILVKDKPRGRALGRLSVTVDRGQRG